MRRALLILLATAGLVGGARAQATGPDGRVSDQEAAYMVANAALGGLSAALQAWLGDRPVLEALGWGAAGGAVSYLGIRTVVRHPGGSPLPGLLLTAAGGNLVRNAADGRHPLSRWILPVGPLYVGVDLDDRARPWVRVSSRRLRGILCLALAGRYRLDARESLRRLAPVFRSDASPVPVPGPGCLGGDSRKAHAFTYGAAIVISDSLATDPSALRRIMAHESGHVAQAIRDDLVLNYGTGIALAERLGAEGWLVIDEITPLRVVSLVLERVGPSGRRWQNSWYEREARSAEGRPLCASPSYECDW